MKRKAIFSVLLIIASFSMLAQNSTSILTDQTDKLAGTWKIDLRPSPESAEYFQSFVVETVNENTFTGTFYGSKIRHAVINKNWANIYFSFTTSDQSNEYYHSGYIENNKLFGITYCPNREFNIPWTGVKD